MIWHQLLIAAGVMAVTFFIHAAMITAAAMVLRKIVRHNRGHLTFLHDILWMMLLSVWLLVAHSLAIAVWSGVYLTLDMVADWEAALYFAGATYTTLGYGDVLAPQQWRILTGATASNGLLLFGLSTAILVDASARLRLGAN
jgi:ion channel